MLYAVFLFFFVKQKTAYEMRISDWSSDVCSSDLFLAHNSVDGFEYPHGLTLEQYQNLRRLAAYLMALPEDYAKFDMGWWTADSRSPGATTCGTVACAGGQGPLAGIPSLPGAYLGDYIPRVFGNVTRLDRKSTRVG